MMRGLLGKAKVIKVVSGRCMSSSCSPWRTAVLSFGDSSQGALGTGGDAYEPTQIPGLPPDVCSIGAGHYHSLAVTAQGQLWAWGRNNEAQLGRGFSAPRESWIEPKRVEGLTEFRVRAAYASGVISAAIGDDGSLWVWGKSNRGQLGLGKGITEAVVPSRVEALAGEDIVKVSLGWGHAIAQTKDGKVFGWGYSADGRLGRIGNALHTTSSPETTANIRESSCSAHEVAQKLVLQAMEGERNMPIIWEPCLIEEVRDPKVLVSDVSCGFDHSLLLCCNGSLLSGGSNTYGQLGRVTEELGMLPVDMSFVPLSIASGLSHSLAVCKIPASDSVVETTSGVVSWGWSQSCQLGRPGPASMPLVVEGLAGESETPVSVAAGRAHSMALTSKGRVWVWGCGRNGRLGLGSSADEAQPALIECLEEQEIVQVASGFDHNLLLLKQ